MSLEDILSRIGTDADAEAETVRQDALKEYREAEETHRRIVEEKFALELERLRIRILDHRKRMEFHCRRESGRQILNARRSILDSAITDAVSRLAASPDKEYLALIDSLIGACGLEGTVEVITSEADQSRITAEYLKKRSTKERKLILSGERHSGTGGVIFRSDRVSENATFSMIAELAHEEMIMKLAPMVPVEGGD
jgi:vacuolar-type H+-ATPase subunit E/Vma4